MHSKGYVHADIKGANILLGTGKGGAEQCYLVDFGLANHYSTKEYKPDPKNAHNGTIEYTSRDAHNGVSTMRGDFEVLGLNLVHWLGLDLPWESQNLLANPKKVQESKEAYMKSLDKQLSGAPEALKSFMKYVERMVHDEKPDYDKCRGYLEKGLKACGKENKGALEFDLGKTTTTTTPKKRVRSSSVTPPDGVLVCVESPKRRKTPVAGPSRKALTVDKKRIQEDSEEEEVVEKESPKKRKMAAKTNKSPVARKDSPAVVKSKDDSSIIILDSPVDTPAMEEVRKKARDRRNGHLTVNNDITPKATGTKKAKKTYVSGFIYNINKQKCNYIFSFIGIQL